MLDRKQIACAVVCAALCFSLGCRAEQKAVADEVQLEDLIAAKWGEQEPLVQDPLASPALNITREPPL